jgi:hypothetical protein
VSNDAAAAIVQRAAGNPLFLEEAARDAGRAVREGGSAALVPGAIRDLVQGRLAQLPEQAREILYAFAVLGANHDPAIVGSLLGLTHSAIAPLLEVLTAEDLLAPDAEGRIGFRHVLTRDTVYESPPNPTAGAARTLRRCDRIARGYPRRRRDGRAPATGRRRGVLATRRLTARPGWGTVAGPARLRAGRNATARCRATAPRMLRRRRVRAAPATTEDVAPLQARVLAAGAQARHFADDRNAALNMARQAAEVVHEGSVPGAEDAALNTLRLAITGPDTLDEILDLTRQIVERAAESGDVDLELEVLLWRIVALLEVGRRAESEAALARLATLAQRVRHSWRLAEMHRMQGMFAHLNGDLATARGVADGEAWSPYVIMLSTIAGTTEARAAVETLLQQRTPQLTTFRWQAFVA